MFDDHLKHKDEFKEKYKMPRFIFFRTKWKDYMKFGPARHLWCFSLALISILPVGVLLTALSLPVGISFFCVPLVYFALNKYYTKK